MRTRIITILSVLILLACAALVVAWPLSHRYWAFIACKHERTSVQLMCAQGRLSVRIINVYPTYPMDEKSLRAGWWWAVSPAHIWGWKSPTGSFWNAIGFGRVSMERMNSQHVNMFFVPLWCVWFMTLPLSVWAVRRTKRQWQAAQRSRRSRRGLCPSCGYDLRASKERCPECGTPVSLTNTFQSQGTGTT